MTRHEHHRENWPSGFTWRPLPNMNDDAYDELLETVNRNLSFRVEPTEAQ